MNNLKPLFLLLFIGIFITAFSVVMQSTQGINEQEAQKVATEAYIYGYPLVTMELTKDVLTNTEIPKDNKAPLGQFYQARVYPDTSFKAVTAPNADTLYSFAWVDLSKEPYILHVPNENDRYYLFPMLSAWTDIFANPGTRTTGTKAADFLITGPNWSGQTPEGMKQFKSPTNLIWILGRTYCTGTPEDYNAVHAIQDQYKLTPLSEFGKNYQPPKGTVNPNIDMKTPVRDQVNQLSAEKFFNILARSLKKNPPAPEDSSIVNQMAAIGIVPGENFDLSTLDPKISAAIQEAPKLALKKILDHEKEAGKEVNGWLFSLETGQYGTAYLQRAYIAAIGLGANLPQDAIYPITTVDSQNNPLIGSNQYKIHFEKGQTPPVNGFWSLTMYNEQYFFVENPLNRYTLSPRNSLQYNDDGSLDLYIQNAKPEKNKESNWLPAPKEHFILMFRFYWPKESLLNGSWTPPAVERVN